MGGDDLGSDDEYWTKPVKEDLDSTELDVSNFKKRKLSDVEVKVDEGSRKLSTEQVLVTLGKDIQFQTAEQQVNFLEASLKHYNLLASNNAEIPEIPLRCIVTSKEETWIEKIKSAVSVKKMKQWKARRSPCVVIVTLSARRAVALLKDLSDLKVRALKLFPKSGDVDSQTEQVAASAYGIAVGTPHRLLKLCEQSNGLHFDSTVLFIVDSFPSSKNYTTCTLPDTAPHFSELMTRFVLPSINKRKDIRLGFF
jgi:hypothetical protein